MTFTALSYFFFLVPVYLVFYFSVDRFRWIVLLIASYGFYATFKAPQLLFALALVTAISFSCGIRLGLTTDESRRKLIFWMGTAGCLIIMLFMKYLPLLTELFGFKIDQSSANLLISIGVSYFSLQAISYLADIYLEIVEPEPHLGYHALSLAFFPKLLQGPIERAGGLLPQLRKTYEFDYDGMRSGMLLFTWGLFKKMVVADRLAIYTNQVYGDVHAYTGMPLVIATYAYALQIYFDFAGYTDMARGTARLFGVNLTENFNSPYLANSVADFWRRWHISFSRWILDYIFKPLQMEWRDWGQAGTALALLITFLFSGIWHGASWGFVIWGLLHGVYLAASTYYRPYQKRIHKWLGIGKNRWIKMWQVFVTFNLVSFAWIFFRAESLGDAWYVVTNMFVVNGHVQTKHNFTMIIVALTMVLLIRIFTDRTKKLMHNSVFRWTLYILLIQVIIFCGVHEGENFVYFKF